MFADYHVHTYYSDDSRYPMEEVVLDALKMGLNEICFTDHVDYGIKEDLKDGQKVRYRDGDPFLNVDYPKYMEEIKLMQSRYSDKICIRSGFEFGVQTHTIPLYESLFKKYPVDFIILSIHQVNDQEFWNQDFQQGKSQKEYNEGYYKELLRVIQKYKDYSVLGHLDLIVRYDKNGIYPFSNVKPLIEEILKTAINDGKGIEVNTSSHRYGLSDTTPSLDILKLYKDLGGKIITIGSDSHKKEHLGTYIKEAQNMLKDLGFTSFCTYENMTPIYHDL